MKMTQRLGSLSGVTQAGAIGFLKVRMALLLEQMWGVSRFLIRLLIVIFVDSNQNQSLHQRRIGIICSSVTLVLGRIGP
jgi:hypothetical protein